MKVRTVADDVFRGPPTERQARAWAALQEHRSVPKAAAAMGVEPANLREACRTYMRKTGMEGPLPFVGKYTRKPGRCPQHDATIARLQQERDDAVAQADALRDLIADLERQAHPWVEVHRKLDALLKRPAGVTTITHRRVADGGVGGKRERKGAA